MAVFATDDQPTKARLGTALGASAASVVAFLRAGALPVGAGLIRYAPEFAAFEEPP